VEIIYSPEAIEDIQYWKKSRDKKTIDRITALISSIENDPFTGIGKPEALKYDLSGFWSRRISKEHRLVYRVISKSQVEIVALRFHYGSK